MHGYIYLTRNKITGSLYVGKHHAKNHNPKYLGSSKTIQAEIKKYGRQAFENTVLAIADTPEQLSALEEQYIREYKTKYPDKCLNIRIVSSGGSNLDTNTEDQKRFVERMTKINRERCSTPEFKRAISVATTKRYEDPAARQAQSEKIKAYWSDPTLRAEQSERLKAHYAAHPKDQSHLHKPCVFELNGQTVHFGSVKELRAFLTDTYSYTPSRSTFRKLMEDGAKRIPFRPFHRTKYAAINGMLIYYAQDD